jgi:hypothetical protein
VTNRRHARIYPPRYEQLHADGAKTGSLGMNAKGEAESYARRRPQGAKTRQRGRKELALPQQPLRGTSPRGTTAMALAVVDIAHDASDAIRIRKINLFPTIHYRFYGTARSSTRLPVGIIDDFPCIGKPSHAYPVAASNSRHHVSSRRTPQCQSI